MSNAVSYTSKAIQVKLVRFFDETSWRKKKNTIKNLPQVTGFFLWGCRQEGGTVLVCAFTAA